MMEQLFDPLHLPLPLGFTTQHVLHPRLASVQIRVQARGDPRQHRDAPGLGCALLVRCPGRRKWPHDRTRPAGTNQSPDRFSVSRRLMLESARKPRFRKMHRWWQWRRVPAKAGCSQPGSAANRTGTSPGGVRRRSQAGRGRSAWSTRTQRGFESGVMGGVLRIGAFVDAVSRSGVAPPARSSS